MILTFFNRGATFFIRENKVLYVFHRGAIFLSSEKIIFAIIRPVAIFFHSGARGVSYGCFINLIGVVYFSSGA